MRSFPVKITVARRIHLKLEANHAAYLAECEEDRRNGYRSHYCEHGVNQWTEYDNICGGCENGDTGPQWRMELALMRAGQYLDELQAATQAFNALSKIPAAACQEAFGDLLWSTMKSIANTYGLDTLAV